MNEIRRKALLWRVPLFAALLTALFWGIWYLVAGSVPVVTSVQLSAEETIQLPFAVSRWTDVLCAPLWAFTLILFFTDRRVIGGEGEDLGVGPRTLLIVGVAAGLIIGSVIGLFYGSFNGLYFGLLVGLYTGLALALSVGLLAGLIVVIRFIFSRSTWQAGWRWLIAADK